METKTIYGACDVVLYWSTDETASGSEFITLRKVLLGPDCIEAEPNDYWASLIGGNLDHFWSVDDAAKFELEHGEVA